MKLNLPQQIEAERIILKKHTLDREYIQLLVDSINKSQQWLAEQIGKSFSTVNAYCCNRKQPSLEILDKVAECLKVDIKELIVERSERDSVNLE